LRKGDLRSAARDPSLFGLRATPNRSIADAVSTEFDDIGLWLELWLKLWLDLANSETYCPTLGGVFG
jgi:hypothetical protein